MLSEHDQKLSADQQAAIKKAKNDWANATTDAQRSAAHNAAEAVRAQAGYSGGADGSGHALLSGSSGGSKVGTGASAVPQSTDGALLNAQKTTQTGGLSADQESQIQALKEQWDIANAEGNQAGMDEAHKLAEVIRAQAGYSGGADGSGYTQIKRWQTPVTGGGYTAENIEEWINAFLAASQKNNPYQYSNGYDVAMIRRSNANLIRQQMKANSDAWQEASAEDRARLHNENVALAALLEKSTAGGGKSTYNEALGRWETENGNLGYGYITNVRGAPDWDPKGDMTAEQREKYANDTGRYYNYVDTDLPRHWVDESSGFTGQYENFVNGPYSQLLMNGQRHASAWADLIGDGFADDQDYRYYTEPKKNPDGSYQLYEPLLKGGNASDYTQSKAAYVSEDGIIMPGVLDGTKSKNAGKNMWLNGGTPMGEAAGENYGVTWGAPNGIAKSPYSSAGFVGMEDFLAEHGRGSGSYEDQINSAYDAELQSQLSQLQAQYDQSLAELGRTAEQTNAEYYDSRRQTTGDAERQAAAWREVSNAQGVNSGAIGQMALVNSGQLQSQINAMNSAEASAQAQNETQRALLAQSYYLQIQQAEAENDYARAQALLQEAQRVDEVLRQQAQMQAQNQLAYLQMMM